MFSILSLIIITAIFKYESNCSLINDKISEIVDPKQSSSNYIVLNNFDSHISAENSTETNQDESTIDQTQDPINNGYDSGDSTASIGSYGMDGDIVLADTKNDQDMYDPIVNPVMSPSVQSSDDYQGFSSGGLENVFLNILMSIIGKILMFITNIGGKIIIRSKRISDLLPKDNYLNKFFIENVLDNSSPVKLFLENLAHFKRFINNYRFNYFK